ncbi:hypothetical protein AS189_17275 [Arthrobacter alpinus]|uniref:Uncharacterized protein n=1 Tax=Arthrobacter alpinus TaxID=656366 RepID=A0A0S2M2Y1_9MICC|nr:hypothetical protein [Arthrobacter alpinus]ALO67912.1 hypothetical protein AS189_17275 [Arthrobacter alpinus]
MKIYGSNIPFGIPARTFVIDGSVAHPVLPFIQVLEKEKFRVTSEPGQNPIRLRYGSFWKDLVADTEFFPTFLLPAKLQRWELTIDVLVAVELDEHGNHAVTITGNGLPRRGNDFLFDVVAKGADAFARSGQLLHGTEFFQGDPKTLKKKGKAAK